MVVCAGRSPQHAGNVALALNPKTGHVSPHFHLVFDDYFETVEDLHIGIVPTRWEWLFQHRRETRLDDKGTPLDNAKVLAGIRLQSSTLFDVLSTNLSNSDSIASSSSQLKSSTMQNEGVTINFTEDQKISKHDGAYISVSTT